MLILKSKITKSIKQFNGWEPNISLLSREFEIFDDDTFVVSYPKSGNTWVRFMLINLMPAMGNASFCDINDRIPDIYNTDHRKLVKYPRPRIIKSHEYLNLRYPRVIYIVRDPRAVVVSSWHYQAKLKVVGELCPLNQYVKDFVARSPYISGFCTWQEHVGGWWGARQFSPDFLFLRYEDMLDDPTGHVRRIARFMGVDADDDTIARVIRNSSFDNMQKLEKQAGRDWQEMAKSHMDRLFVRRGESESWREELDPDSIRLIEENWGGTMALMGYKTSLSDNK